MKDTERQTDLEEEYLLKRPCLEASETVRLHKGEIRAGYPARGEPGTRWAICCHRRGQRVLGDRREPYGGTGKTRGNEA